MNQTNNQSTNKPLAGRRALITGGGAGLGLIFAEALAEAGADLFLCGRRADVLDTAAQALRRHGQAVDCQPCDVTKPADIASLKAAAGRIDILVNNAGYSLRTDSWLDVSFEDWNEVINVNLTGQFLMAQAFLPQMMERGWGRVVNLSSVYGLRTINPAHYPDMKSDNFSYSVAKHGLIGMTKHIAVRAAGSGVTANVLCPGFFVSQSKAQRSDGVTAGALTAQRLREAIPVGRTGSDDDLRGIIVYLCSDASAYMTGQAVTVDGGFTVW